MNFNIFNEYDNLMEEIKNIVNDLGIDALEANTKLASIAVVSDAGELIHQTENWDLRKDARIIPELFKGERSFTLNNYKFTVDSATSEGITSTHEGGMGHVIIVPFEGGTLVTFAMFGADPNGVLKFLKPYAMKLNGKV